jgi:hypothetical protein
MPWIVTYMKVAALISATTAAGFGLLVFLKNRKAKVSQIFFAMTLGVALWSVGVWQFLFQTEHDPALFWMQVTAVGSFIIPVTFFHWILLLTDKLTKTNKVILLSSYAFLGTVVLFIKTPLVIHDVVPKLSLLFWPSAGVLYTFYFLLIYSGLTTYALFILFREFLKGKGVKRKQLFFVLLGAAIGFGGGLTGFPLIFDIPILPYGNILISVFPFLLSYSMLKYHLFDVKSIATEILVFFILVVLLAQVILSTSITEFILRLIFLLIVSFLGYLLIKSSYRLADLNENLEERVQQQAGEIKEAYEVEKKARIELERLNEEKDRFLLATQHNLRTPLTIIKGYIEVALAREKNRESRRDLGHAAAAGEKMTNVLNNVLEVTEKRVKK